VPARSLDDEQVKASIVLALIDDRSIDATSYFGSLAAWRMVAPRTLIGRASGLHPLHCKESRRLPAGEHRSMWWRVPQRCASAIVAAIRTQITEA
jgi:hypothetical protein